MVGLLDAPGPGHPQEIEKLEAQQDATKRDFEEKTRKMTEWRERWLQPLHECIEKLNVIYQEYCKYHDIKVCSIGSEEGCAKLVRGRTNATRSVQPHDMMLAPRPELEYFGGMGAPHPLSGPPPPPPKFSSGRGKFTEGQVSLGHFLVHKFLAPRTPPPPPPQHPRQAQACSYRNRHDGPTKVVGNFSFVFIQ